MGETYRLKGIELRHVPKGVSLLAVAAFRLSRALKSDVTKIVSRNDGLSLVSWRILMGLSLVKEASQKQLIEFTRMEQAQVSRHLTDMIQQGLIDTRASQVDRRTKLFFLTERGRQKHSQLHPDVARLADAMDSALSDQEQLQFLEMCLRIEQASQRATKDLSVPIQHTNKTETEKNLQEETL